MAGEYDVGWPGYQAVAAPLARERPALGRLFVDYEPGIHWSQLQMQSGTQRHQHDPPSYNQSKTGARITIPAANFSRQLATLKLPRHTGCANLMNRGRWRPPPRERVGAVCSGCNYPFPIVENQTIAAREPRKDSGLGGRSWGFAEWAMRFQKKARVRRFLGLQRDGGQRRRRSWLWKHQQSTQLGAESRVSLDPKTRHLTGLERDRQAFCDPGSGWILLTRPVLFLTSPSSTTPIGL